MIARAIVLLCALAVFSIGAAISDQMTGRDVFTYLFGALFGMFVERRLARIR